LESYFPAFTADEQYFIDNLDRAMAEEWIKAYHQPLLRAASGMVSEEEALARWEDPKKGMFIASDFVPVLDRAHLSYKLDLYMVERVLNKMKGQGEHGLFIVPESINISRSDFDSCDMVKEITKRIDASGLPREKISVELSEKVISSDVEFMKKQVERFHDEGIRVWMDDFGSGHSSLLLLTTVKFDLLKIDESLVGYIGKNEAGQIILTELIKTALALGIDTVAEGIETKEQADFLMEIGCTKLQGFYFIHPVSLATIIERNQKGIQIGFENPDEFEYYEQLGKINLYDLSFTQNDDSSLKNYFDTMPMVIFALDDKMAKFIRCNKSYRKFLRSNFNSSFKKLNIDYDTLKPGIGIYSFNAVKQCAEDGKRVIIDDRLDDGRMVQLLIQRIAVNPVTGARAVMIVVLSVTDAATDESLNYNYVARALAADYLKLYFVDMDTDRFTEYNSDGVSRDISMERHGTDFFNFDKGDFDLVIPDEDRKVLKNVFTKDAIEKGLKESGTFSTVTKVLIDDTPTFVNIKVVRVRGNGNHVIVGLSSIDAQVKAREALDKAKEEKIIYSRIGALSGDYIYLYTVDPVTDHYNKYNPTGIISEMAIANEGDHFFEDVIEKIPVGIYKDDMDAFLTAFTKENVMKEIESKGLFENHHRLIINGKPTYVTMRATIVEEEGEKKLIVGILNIDERIRKEMEYEKKIFAAENMANLDELTGVRNKHSYADAVKKMNERISSADNPPFAIAVFDLNNLKTINDTLGHQAGDKYIKKGCDTICRFFKHSPVFRIGGDEFAVVVTGYDYLNIDSIMTRFRKHIRKNKKKGDVVVASGMSRYDNDKNVSPVFKRADEEMYENKRKLKEADA
jgi:diguanylate cyclase (GGDEF)-like protein